MAIYTVAELKDYTSVPIVKNWSNDKILIYQQMAESILDSLNLDDSLTGYQDALEAAVLILFDWLAANPTALKSSGKGKVNQQFMADELPLAVRTLLAKYMEGEVGSLTGTMFERSDIGRR